MIRLSLCRLLAALLVAASLAMPTIAAVSDPGPSDTSARQLTEAERSALRAVTAALASTPDRVDAVLSELGFDNIAKTIPGFAKWPPLRKIEAAYWSAVTAKGAPEGVRLLRGAAKIIERDYTAAISEEPHLGAYMVSPDTDEPIAFVRPSPKRLAELPPPEVRNAILALERYTDRVPGGLQGLMVSCCFQDLDQVYLTLHASNTRLDALVSAVQNGRLPPEIKERLLRAIRLVIDRSAAAAYEPALASILKQLDPQGYDALTVGSPTSAAKDEGHTVELDKLREVYERARRAAYPHSPPDFMPFAALGIGPPGAPGPGIPPSTPRPPSQPPGGGSSGNAQKYEEALRSIGGTSSPGAGSTGGDSSSGGGKSFGRGEERPGGGSISFPFDVMRLSPHGFGGVVFGNTVESTAIGKPLRAGWVSDAAQKGAFSPWGHFDVVLDTHAVVMTRRMLAEDAFAAGEIVGGRVGSFGPLNIAGKEGVGLASVDRRPDQMLVHPALYGLELGNAAAFADAVGFKMAPGAFCRRLERAHVALPIIQHALQWQTAENGYYKIIDAPLRVAVSNGNLTVLQSTSKIPSALAQVAFLDFQALRGDEAVATPDFTPSVPGLVAAFPEYARLNAFAETFAIVRWAAAAKATIKLPPKPSPVPARLIITLDADGGLIASTDNTTPGSGSEIGGGDAAGEGLACQLRAMGVPASSLSWLHDLIAARQELTRIGVVEYQLTKSGSDGNRVNAAERILRALEEQERAPNAVLKRFETPEGIVAVVNPGPNAEKLVMLGGRLAHAKDEVDQAQANVDAITDPMTRMDALSPTLKPRADSLLDKYLTAIDSAESTNSDSERSKLLAEAQNARVELLGLLPAIDEVKLSKALDALSRAQASEASILREHDQLLESLAPVWLRGADKIIMNFAAGDFY